MERSGLAVIPANTTESPFLDSSKGSKRGREPEDNGNGGFFYGDAASKHDKKKRRDQPPPSYLCKICKAPGHYISDCPTRTSDTPSRGPDSGISPSYICKICNQGGHHIRDCPAKKKTKDLPGCWFCLSNPKLEKHLIVNIGSEAYVALAKGGLSEWGGNILIVPLGHYANMRSLQNSPGGDAVLNEIQRIKKDIRSAFQKREEEPIFFESYSGATSPEAINRVQHMYIQIIPVPKELLGAVITTFESQVEKDGLEIISRDGTLPASTFAPYLSFEIPLEDREGMSMMVISASAAKLQEMEIAAQEALAFGRVPPRLFDVNFGRRVLAELMNMPDRIQWSKCILPADEEKRLTDSVRGFLNLNM
ncbi:hypothetical protein HDU67_007925 [Dinochytrium kinnereticum]|nr:hypothetical protein HDU67_007925 [Dinochytrium kinnereticum]